MLIRLHGLVVFFLILLSSTPFLFFFSFFYKTSIFSISSPFPLSFSFLFLSLTHTTHTLIHPLHSHNPTHNPPTTHKPQVTSESNDINIGNLGENKGVGFVRVQAVSPNYFQVGASAFYRLESQWLTSNTSMMSTLPLAEQLYTPRGEQSIFLPTSFRNRLDYKMFDDSEFVKGVFFTSFVFVATIIYYCQILHRTFFSSSSFFFSFLLLLLLLLLLFYFFLFR